MERQLVTIRTVSELRPIPDADAIETAVVDGWTCVVKKGTFAVGDPAVYFEIDSLLPLADPRFHFLKKSDTSREFHRLKTMKLRKQLSQGLLLPVAEFPELTPDCGDMAAALGITKWEPMVPAHLAGIAKGLFPSFIRRTDEERIQNMPWVLVDEADSLFEVTIKLDGSSMTVFHRNGDIGVCSRNLELLETPENTHWQVVRRLHLDEALLQLKRNVAVQGELMGPGIQGNREALKEHGFFIFNVFDIDKREYMPVDERKAFVDSLMSFDGCLVQVCPTLGIHRLGEFQTMQDILAFADGPSLHNKIREGVVFKRLDGALSFKVISNQFLLAE